LQRAVIGVVLAYFRGNGHGEGAGWGYGVWLSANTFARKNLLLKEDGSLTCWTR
jgi:hypothetical protein